MAENPGGGSGAKATTTHLESRVALGDLTNVVATEGRLSAPDAVRMEKEVDETRKLKSCTTNFVWLKEKLLEEEDHMERTETELPKMKRIEAKADKLELEFGSCEVLLNNKPDVSTSGDISQKWPATNWNEISEATLAKDSVESANGEVNWLGHPLAARSEESDKPMKEQSMLTKQETRNADDTSLKDMLSGIHGMDKIIITIDELIACHQDERSIFDERLSVLRSKVQSLEQERDQLCLKVALLQSKLGHGDYSASSTEVQCIINPLAMDCEAKPKLNETEDLMQTVVELKGHTGGTKKQPAIIEIFDDEDTTMWYDDDEKPSLQSNVGNSGEPGSGSCKFLESYKWFFCGNKLMLACGIKKYLKELCGCVPPEIPFYLYRMNKSNLKRKGKMRLSAKFISKAFLSCLHEGEGYAHFQDDGDDRGTVRVKLNADGRASLTTGWENVVAAKDIKAGDICAFHFKVSDGVLKLSVYVFHAVCHLMRVR
ncbi:hypothetical protein BS78_09G110200 [Paspalum vaginatum]|nr:hypothetical protein BS78_09G110200 [Paspalum vaginatum]